MLIVACIALASGCATYVNPAYFRPAEGVVSTTPTSEKQALYDLVMPDGHPGEAKVGRMALTAATSMGPR
jgi:hypothetical protein